MITSDPAIRRLGQLAESVHAVVYFSPEPLAGYAGLGLRGYWRGYYASRAAPLGKASAETVKRLFGVFAPGMVDRAVPEIWTQVDPEAALAARLEGAIAALRRLLGDTDVSPAIGQLRLVTAAMTAPGRLDDKPMAAAVAALPVPADPLGELWWHCTLLREWRGDAHLAGVLSEGLVWPEPDLLRELRGTATPEMQGYRGWTDDAWAAARERVTARLAGAPPDELAERIEAATDRAADIPGVDLEAACAALEPIAALTVGQLPFPNAMGLPARGVDEG